MQYNIKNNCMDVFFEEKLDYKTIPEIKKNLSKNLKKTEITSLVFDLNKVNYMDTSGLSFFIFFSERYKVDIVNVSGELKYIFDLNKKNKYNIFLK